MNKTDIVRNVYEQLDKKVAMKELDKVLDAILDVISEGLRRGEEIQLADFGTFSLTSKSIQPILKSVKKKK
jgi:nucleoid DNA-binding protein